MRRRAFVCATPFQIFNAVHVLAMPGVARSWESDIYIVEGFANSDAMVKNLAKSGFFSRVMIVPASMDAYGWGAKKERAGENGEHAKARLRKWMEEVFGSARRYDEILFSLPTLSAEVLAESFPDAKLSLFDDGYGSYRGDIREGANRGVRI